VLLAIAGMSLVTYGTRLGGYLLFRAIRPSQAVRTLLGYIPGTLFVAYVAPALAHGRWPEWCGSAAAACIMIWTRELSAAVLGGTAVAWLVWAWV
jgi:uncharacterized membrane protein